MSSQPLSQEDYFDQGQQGGRGSGMIERSDEATSMSISQDSRQRKSSEARQKSVVWQHFDVEGNVAKCKHCM